MKKYQTNQDELNGYNYKYVLELSDLLGQKDKGFSKKRLELYNNRIENDKKQYSKTNKKLSKNTPIQTIKSNVEYYSNYLNKKFKHFKYDKEYMFDSLSSDLVDFEEFVKIRTEKEKDIYDTLIKNVQDSVNKSIPDYEVNLYGSHATIFR